MIRSNPTAIPLRASDVKLLQIEIDKRRAERESTVSTSDPRSSVAVQNRTTPAHDQGEEGRIVGKEKKRSAAERIGL
ncbi:hypothetical protein IAR55_004089 [Kwoniella newhampshirensis]|uniref:Uncharacterized protein n=1 Tax=Kwoniella newhampshirensis TaxID=1651941 RepID=A0AAW0YY72_9TREE